MMSLYLALNVFTIAFPLVRSFESRIRYAQKWKALAPGLALTAAFFITWDVIFTRAGIWGFNPKYLIGNYIFALPIEEWLFFVTVPFASIFIYECVLHFLPDLKTGRWLNCIGICAATVLICTSILNTDRAYTFWCFLFGGSLLFLATIRNPSWLASFVVCYLIHLIPFFIVNGALTGAFTAEHVVWYNQQENLNIRLYTVPIEDTIYALVLLLMNVIFFEWFKKIFSHSGKNTRRTCLQYKTDKTTL